MDADSARISVEDCVAGMDEEVEDEVSSSCCLVAGNVSGEELMPVESVLADVVVQPDVGQQVHETWVEDEDVVAEVKAIAAAVAFADGLSDMA